MAVLAVQALQVERRIPDFSGSCVSHACGVFIISADYRFSPDICTDGLVFSMLMIFPAGYFFGGTMLKVRPKTYNTKHTTTGDHVDRRILQYSRANKRITACHTELVLCIVTHVLCKGIIREITKI